MSLLCVLNIQEASLEDAGVMDVLTSGTTSSLGDAKEGEAAIGPARLDGRTDRWYGSVSWGNMTTAVTMPTVLIDRMHHNARAVSVYSSI